VLLTASAHSRLRVLGVNPLHEVQCKDLRMFRRTAGSKQSPFCVIYYMLSSGGFGAACLQAIATGVSSILGHPGQTRAMFQASTTRRPVHTLTTVEGLVLLVPPRTPRSSGYDVYAHAVYVVICYMSIILN
jgi:hypothetical protein